MLRLCDPAAAYNWHVKIDDAYQLALEHYQANRLTDVARVLRQILAARPDYSDAIHLAGLLAHRGGTSPKAVAFIRRAILINPNVADYYDDLGLILAGQGDADAGIEAIQKAIALRPEQCRPYKNLGTLYSDRRQWDLAIECFRKALALDPAYVEAESGLANALTETGELDDAIASYRRLAQSENDPRLASKLLNLLHFHSDYGPSQIIGAHFEWDQTFAAPLRASIQPHGNDPAPHRRLKVGYVSPDFRQHSIGRFIAPLLENHDHERVEVFCYSDVSWPDALTQRLQLCADLWRDTAYMTDQQLAQQIRDDGIDVLFDLAAHTEGNRLMAFARKPAPVQASYLANCGTTGLRTIDYRLTDPYLDSPDEFDDSFHRENRIRLNSYWCYEPFAEPLEVIGLPEALTGALAFGYVNHFSHITTRALDAWTEILARVPGSHLAICADPGSHRNKIISHFEGRGVSGERVQFMRRPSGEACFSQCAQIDIALDSFPFAGSTASCDALWMGVPLVSLAGRTAVSRSGVSILSAIGLADLVARTTDEYVELVVQLAMNRDRRSMLRKTQRDRMRSSPLMDAAAFSRDFESVIRRMWVAWCAGR